MIQIIRYHKAMAISEKVQQLALEYGRLNDEDRHEFVRLVGAVDEGEVIEEWSQELRSRAHDIDSGRVQLVDGDDFLERLSQV